MDYLSDQDPEQSDVKILVEQYEEALANNRQPIIAEETVEQIVEYYENYGHYDKALQIINTALDHFPYSGQILWKKAQVLYDLKICDEAMECLENGFADATRFYAYPKEHWKRIRSNNGIERLHVEIKRRTKAVGAFPDRASALRLVTAVAIESTSIWSVRKYLDMSLLSKPPKEADQKAA